MDMQISERYVDDVMGCRTRYLVAGEGPPIVFLSGWLGSAENVIPLMELLSSKYRCVAVDMPGLGRSAPFKKTYHSIENYALFLKEFIKKMEVEEAAIIGISMGGSIALKFAVIDESTKARKVVIQSPGYKPLTIDAHGRQLLGIMSHFPLVAKLFFLSTRFRPVQKYIYQTGDDNVSSITFEQLIDYGLPSLPYFSIKALNESIVDLVNFDMRNDLPNIKDEILLIYGTLENLFSREYEDELKQKLVHCHYAEFENATHYLMISRPKEMADKIMEFLTN